MQERFPAAAAAPCNHRKCLGEQERVTGVTRTVILLTQILFLSFLFIYYLFL